MASTSTMSSSPQNTSKLTFSEAVELAQNGPTTHSQLIQLGEVATTVSEQGNNYRVGSQFVKNADAKAVIKAANATSSRFNKMSDHDLDGLKNELAARKGINLPETEVESARIRDAIDLEHELRLRTQIKEAQHKKAVEAKISAIEEKELARFEKEELERQMTLVGVDKLLPLWQRGVAKHAAEKGVELTYSDEAQKTEQVLAATKKAKEERLQFIDANGGIRKIKDIREREARLRQIKESKDEIDRNAAKAKSDLEDEKNGLALSGVSPEVVLEKADEVQHAPVQDSASLDDKKHDRHAGRDEVEVFYEAKLRTILASAKTNLAKLSGLNESETTESQKAEIETLKDVIARFQPELDRIDNSEVVVAPEEVAPAPEVAPEVVVPEVGAEKKSDRTVIKIIGDMPGEDYPLEEEQAGSYPAPAIALPALDGSDKSRGVNPKGASTSGRFPTVATKSPTPKEIKRNQRKAAIVAGVATESRLVRIGRALDNGGARVAEALDNGGARIGRALEKGGPVLAGVVGKGVARVKRVRMFSFPNEAEIAAWEKIREYKEREKALRRYEKQRAKEALRASRVNRRT